MPRRKRSCRLERQQGRLTINGVFAKIPEGDFTVAEAWSATSSARSGTCRRAPPRTCSATGAPRQVAMIGNDCWPSRHRAEPAPRARVPELLPRRELRVRELHELERVSATLHLDRSRQADRGQRRARHARHAVVTEEMFTKGLIPYELSAEVDQKWLDAWTEIQAGGSIRRQRRPRRPSPSGRPEAPPRSDVVIRGLVPAVVLAVVRRPRHDLADLPVPPALLHGAGRGLRHVDSLFRTPSPY